MVMMYDHLGSETNPSGLSYIVSSSLNMGTATWSAPTWMGSPDPTNTWATHFRHGGMLPIYDAQTMATVLAGMNYGIPLGSIAAAPPPPGTFTVSDVTSTLVIPTSGLVDWSFPAHDRMAGVNFITADPSGPAVSGPLTTFPQSISWSNGQYAPGGAGTTNQSKYLVNGSATLALNVTASQARTLNYYYLNQNAGSAGSVDAHFTIAIAFPGGTSSSTGSVTTVTTAQTTLHKIAIPFTSPTTGSATITLSSPDVLAYGIATLQ